MQLLEARKAEGQTKDPEPLRMAPHGNVVAQQGQTVEKSDTAQEQPVTVEAEEQTSKPAKSKEAEGQSGSSKHKHSYKAIPSKKFTMNIPPQKAHLQISTNTSSVPESSSVPNDRAPASSASDNKAEPVLSRRLKKLANLELPVPSAPTTRLRRRSQFLKKQDPSLLSPLTQSRIKAIEQSQSIPDSDIHPADPLNSFTAFPGSAVRDVVKEFSEPENLEHRERLWSEDIKMKPVQPPEIRPVPVLEHGLDRVLFKFGPF